MDQPKSQITHYVPKWVLSKFRNPALLELDIYTLKIEQRSLDNAGSGRDLWPEDTEGLLSEHDNAAAQIYRKKIMKCDPILLTTSERETFALWLAHFYIRSPKRLVRIDGLIKDLDPEDLVRELEENKDGVIARLSEQNPEAWYKLVNEIGESEARVKLLADYAHVIRTASLQRLAPKIWNQYFYLADTERFADILLKYHWSWLHSHHGFVIGDDPLIPWHLESKRWEYGIAREGVEITMPLTLNICLCLQQSRSPHRNGLQYLSKHEARTLNCRQRLSAVKYVYGNSSPALDFVKDPILI